MLFSIRVLLVELAQQKVRFTLVSAMLISFLSVMDVPAHATVRYVNKTDPNCQGHLPCYSSIQAAINVVQPGDAIRIQTGQYDEVLSISGKNNTPNTAEEDRIVIEADPASAPGSVVLGGPAQSCTKGDRILIESSKFITIRGLTITDTGKQSIILKGAAKKNDAITIEGNRIYGNGAAKCKGGLLIERSNTNTVVANNLIYGNGQVGLEFKLGPSGPHLVVGNTIHANSEEGVFINKDQDVLLVNNIITGNGANLLKAIKDGFGVKRKTAKTNTHPELAQLLNNLICGNKGGANGAGELDGALLDGTDAGNLTPTGSEGAGVSHSVACGNMANVYANLKGPDGQALTTDDNFTLATNSPAVDSGTDPRDLGLDTALTSVVTSDFTGAGTRPQDGNLNGSEEFDRGAMELPEPCLPGETKACYSGPEGTQGAGQCQEGERACRPDGVFGACTGEVLPGIEIQNNGIDEDCDGHDQQCVPGTTQSCYTGPLGTLNVGICRAGIQTCTAGGFFGTCEGQQLPLSEIPSDGIDQNCNGVDLNPPPPPGTVSISIGQVVNGNIAVVGEQDSYHFIATAGQIVFFDSHTPTSCSSSLRWTLKDESGGIVFQNRGVTNCSDEGLYTLTRGGEYFLAVFGNGTATGAYQIQLWNVPAPDQSVIAIGQVVDGNIETPGVQDIYTFSASAGQTLYFDVHTGNCFSRHQWTLFDPDGLVVFQNQGLTNCGEVGLRTLTKSGTYTLKALGSGDATGSYQFQIWNVPAPDQSPLTLGEVRSGYIETPGVQDIYTFSASAGQTLYFDVHTPTGCLSSSHLWTLLDPDGLVVFQNAGVSNCGEIGLKTMPKTGTYTLKVFGSYDVTGPYEFQVNP